MRNWIEDTGRSEKNCVFFPTNSLQPISLMKESNSFSQISVNSKSYCLAIFWTQKNDSTLLGRESWRNLKNSWEKHNIWYEHPVLKMFANNPVVDFLYFCLVTYIIPLEDYWKSMPSAIEHPFLWVFSFQIKQVLRRAMSAQWPNCPAIWNRHKDGQTVTKLYVVASHA